MMTYYKRERVKTPDCGPLCNGHTIYYGVNEKSWLFNTCIRTHAFKLAQIESPSWHVWFDETPVSATEVIAMLIFGGCAVDDVKNIHQHKKVYVTGKLPVDI